MRVGTTSFILPDAIIPNLHYLADKVDDVELLVFESDEISPLPTRSEVLEMSEIAAGSDLTYSVHLPVDIDLGVESTCARDVEKLKRAIDRMAPLDPSAWVLHLQAPTNDEWCDNVLKSLKSLLPLVDKSKLCIENTDFDYRSYLPLVDELGISTCLDIGHLLILGDDYKELLERSKVVHIHGVEGKRDHRDLTYLSSNIIKDIVENFKGDVMTLEVFNKERFLKSLPILKEYL